ncbi:MAG: SpoIIE family protein phosphatase [Planctomycetaceae bacterium]|nr:SpoIIE family protein phosphatase [Planctomycetaceae bacterium]
MTDWFPNRILTIFKSKSPGLREPNALQWADGFSVQESTLLNSNSTNPRWFMVSVIVIGSVVGLLGWVAVLTTPLPRTGTLEVESSEILVRTRGQLIHTALQSVGASLAILTAVCAFSHSNLVRDQTTAVVGAALMFAGLIDAFHIAVLDQFGFGFEDAAQFGPFTWALSRIFHASIVALGTGPFAWGLSTRARLPFRGGWLLAGACAVMTFGTFSIIEVCAQSEDLPDALRPLARVPRAFDALALIIYLIAGGVLLPRFYKRHPSLFSYGLLLSLAPHILGELFAAFGSRSAYDSAFVTAQCLKLVGYAVPLAGLLVDYSRVYLAEGELRATQEKLRVAREIQRGLLPQQAPHCPTYRLGGVCIPTDAVGGDFFDYIPMADDCLGVVIADVSGHDLGAAILMSQARAYLRAEASYSKNPAELLSRVNTFLCRDVRDRRFISMMLVLIDPTKSEIVYAAAGHGGYVISEGGLVRELPPTGPVLGVLETDFEMGEPVTLAPGQSMVLITDGWPEANSPSGEAYGMRRVYEVLAANADADPQTFLDSLLHSVLDFRWQSPPEDDLTAVVVQLPKDSQSEGSHPRQPKQPQLQATA